MASFEVSQNVITSDEDSNEMVETNEIVVESETEEVYAGKRKFIRGQKDKYTMEEKIELAKLVQQYKEEYENDKSKKQHQGYVARAVREFYTDLKNAKHDDPRLSKAMKMASRAVKRKCDDPAGLETTSSKKSFRATGGGRKVTYPEVRIRLFEWFIDIRGSLKGRLPRLLFKSQATIFYDEWLSQQDQPVPESERPVFSNNWISGWMREHRVSLRKPNKRYQIKYDDRVERIQEYILNIWRVRKYFWDNFNVEIPIVNGDQMPLHRN